eukprot:5826970-Pleurochrysis_carterae.AAC.1
MALSFNSPPLVPSLSLATRPVSCARGADAVHTHTRFLPLACSLARSPAQRNTALSSDPRPL